MTSPESIATKKGVAMTPKNREGLLWQPAH